MDTEIVALRQLLLATDEKPAGTPERRKWVAERAGCSPDNLYQVAAGIALKSGRPRSLGRDLKEKLDAAFPGWMDRAGLPERLADLVIDMSPSRWVSVRAQLDRLPGHPEMRDDVIEELRALLTAPSRKAQHAA